MTALGGLGNAQVPPITSSGLNTQVSAPVNLPSGEVQHNITGGARPGGGGNLFHSFGEFGVPTDNIANFLNDAGLPTTNILSRVTGGNPSNILGTIKTEGFGNANLFLMNPAGIMFGPNASLNVGGATHFTTANYLKLADGVQFTALPSGQDALLSIASVAAFGFLDSTPAPIAVEGSTLTVNDGKTLSLVGGNITIGSGLTAPGGNIAVTSVASPGEVLADTYASAPNVNGQSFTTMGTIVLSEGATLDVSADAAGTVIIRGGQLMMTNATISADTVDSDSALLAVDIQLTGDLSMIDTQGTQGNTGITARTTGAGNAGEVRIASENLNASSTSLDFYFSLIDTHTSGSGTAGRVNITAAGTIQATGEKQGGMYLIDSGTIGLDGGHGGEVVIVAEQLQLADANITTGDWIANNNGVYTTGSGGDVTIIADTIQLNSTLVVTDGFFEGKAGDVSITAKDVQLHSGSIRLSEFGGGGTLTLNTKNLALDTLSFIESETVDGIGAGLPWTALNINADVVTLQGGSVLRSQTFGDGAAGDIRVIATDRMILSDVGDESRPSGVFTNSFGDVGLGDQGPAGNIFIETKSLALSGGARFDTTTQSSGKGGDVTVLASDGVVISGQREFPSLDRVLGLGGLPSGIFSRTIGSNFCTGPCGDAGHISVTTSSLNVTDGAAINSGTTNDGRGGTITVNASENISIGGTLVDGTPGGVFSRTTGTDPDSGQGGNIILTAGNSFFLQNGATVSASSSGPANAGNIHVTANDKILIDKASITTDATLASGGNIKLTADEIIQLVDSTIESSVQGDVSTVGGDISLDPDFIILQNSKILAKAVAGQGGNISLIANEVVLVDQFSVLDASSSLGVSGSVNIQAPTKFLSGTITPLPKDPAPVTNLYGARCAAGQGGNFSTFVDSKAASLAPQPGTFLASPFLPASSSSAVAVSGHMGSPTAGSKQAHPALLQVAAYSPSVLFGPIDEMLTACP